ncbi:MAG: polysaccharide pyruvyl transferase family protein [Lachnospiraceae bacterium]
MNAEKTITVLPKSECCGCGSCYNICPQKAISMNYDREGFLYPEIEEEKCISCGKCRKACPSVSGWYDNDPVPDCYAALGSDEVRKSSSSGGMFTLFAQYVLNRGGAVCGAAYDENFKVKHMVIHSARDLEKLKKSKYVQSDTGTVYSEIEGILKEGRPVLFCGCPCQVAGLKTFLKEKGTENCGQLLYTLDLLCHGAPSPVLFEKYLKEKYGSKPIAYVGFRDKDYYGWIAGMSVQYTDGSWEHCSRSRDVYLKAFNFLMSTRPHCGQCKFSRVPRQGDITMGDFWGIDRYDKRFSDGKGTSIISINNSRGQELLDAVKDQLKDYGQIPSDYIYKTGQPFDHCFQSSPARARFLDMAAYHSIDKAYEYAIKRKYDVAIMGVWCGCNYGSIMTYYALCRLVESFGLSVLMVDKPKLGKDDPELKENHSRRFARENYKAISRSYPVGELKALNAQADTFIIGSDQVWNYGISRNFGRSYFFDFVDEDKKKISYASSFGHDGFFASGSEKETTAHLLRRFDAISVREAKGVSICRDTFHVKAVQVLDPVFMVDPAIYDELAARSSADEQEEYVVSYILDPTPEKREALQYVAKQYKCKLVNMLDGIPWKFRENKEKMNLPNTVENLQVEDWLYYLKHSRFIITDSCHGASFAIIFKRPFICIANKHRGLSRFESLLSLFHLTDRYVTDPSEIMKPGNRNLLSDIDYDAVYEIMEKERFRSREWLKNALFAPKTIHNWREYPIIDEEMKISYENKIRELQEELRRERKNSRSLSVRAVGKMKKVLKKVLRQQQ